MQLFLNNVRFDSHRFVFVDSSILSDIILSKPVHFAQRFHILLHLVVDYCRNVLPLPVLFIVLFAFFQVLLLQTLSLLDIPLNLLFGLNLLILQ